uniref:Uncharacterized protein n=1 Tax=Gloeochaete wittrockiana TaxID=38269 RepID=A0A3G1IVZ4_9EUKA|nr:hypothetical protein Ycf51 [Gloeochaete wittrockiana]ASQ40193.1 hypothetical protein Ycf51 [Gloeochaete wittrockiana]
MEIFIKNSYLFNLFQIMSFVNILLCLLSIICYIKNWSILKQLIRLIILSIVITCSIVIIKLLPRLEPKNITNENFSKIYDNGYNQIVIALPKPTSEKELVNILKKAGADALSPGRLVNENLFINLKVRSFTGVEYLKEQNYIGELELSLNK